MKPTITQITLKMIFRCFKKLAMPILSLIIYITSHAQAYPVAQLTAAHKEIISDNAFENVEITGDVTLVLTNEQTTNIMLSGNSKDIDVVKTTELPGKLEINAEKKKTVSKLFVYLPVTNIHSLKVTGNAQIFSSGFIKVNDLDIILNGESMVKVYCYGNLKVRPAEGYEMTN